MTVNMKHCSKCKTVKDTSCFSKKRTNPDGLQRWCKNCCTNYNKSSNGRAAQQRYRDSEKGAQYRETYNKTPKRKETLRKSNRHRKAVSKYKQCTCCSKTEVRQFVDSVPRGYELDHLVPSWAGGLHCLSNLQILTPDEHRAKSGPEHSEYWSTYYPSAQ